jgi:hypothetical protein
VQWHEALDGRGVGGCCYGLAVAGWLERLRGRLTGKPVDVVARRVDAVIAARGSFASTAAWLEAVLAATPREIGAGLLAHLAISIEGSAGSAGPVGPAGDDVELAEGDGGAWIAFWGALAARAPELTAAQAYLAAAELRFGDARAALERFLDAFEAEPALWFDFAEDIEEIAEQVGGESLFRWQLAALRAALAEVPDDDEWIRERYSELLDMYRDQPERLLRLYPIGEEIRRLESEGALPRAMVVRVPRPPRRPP